MKKSVDTFSFTIKVIPNAKAHCWKLQADGTLKCYLISPALEGKANNELIKRIAQITQLPTHCISIKKGLTSRIKQLVIAAPYDYQKLLRAIGLDTIDTQLSFFEDKK